MNGERELRSQDEIKETRRHGKGDSLSARSNRGGRDGKSWRVCEEQSGAVRGGLLVFRKKKMFFGEDERTHNLAPVICWLAAF